MSGKRFIVFAIAVVMVVAGGAAFGLPPGSRIIGDGSPGPQEPRLMVSDSGTGSIAVVFIAGGQVPRATLEAMASELAPRYRTILFSLDEALVASFGGMSETAAELARLLAGRGIGLSCIVGCCSAATIIDEAAAEVPAIRGAVLFGTPQIAPVTRVPIVYVAAPAESSEVMYQVDRFLDEGADRAMPMPAKARRMRDAWIPY